MLGLLPVIVFELAVIIVLLIMILNELEEIEHHKRECPHF